MAALQERERIAPVSAFASCYRREACETDGRWGKSGAGEKRSGTGTGMDGADAGGVGLRGGS